MNMDSVIDFVTSGDVSDLSDLSSDDESDDEVQQNNIIDRLDDDAAEADIPNNDDDGDDEDNVPLALIAGDSATNKDPGSSNDQQRVYRWRKKDPPTSNDSFLGNFSDPPLEDVTPLGYFKMFFTEDILSMIVEQTNLYSTQKRDKCVNTNITEIRKLIGMHILMGIVKVPTCRLLWSKSLRFPQIADVIPLGRFELLKRSLHVVDNTTYNPDNDDKLFKIRPLIEAVRNECIKVEPEEYQSVDEQIIPSKTKRTKIRQYNPKKPKKWGFKNLVRAGASGYMYDFYVYAGKGEPDPESNLQKSAQVVSKLCKDLPSDMKHKIFFDNWFTTVELLHYLKSKGLLGVGTIRQNRIHNCPLKSTKDLEKEGRGAMDYRTDNNSGIVIARWVDNKTLQLCSNYVGIEPLGSVQRWSKADQRRVQVPSPQIVIAYNKSMGGVDLADMLISLYRIPCKTHRWYIKVFWHLVDIAKVNSWILYRRHCEQKEIPKKNQLTLLKFSIELADALMNSSQRTTPSRGRPRKRPLENAEEEQQKPGKAPAQPNPCPDVRFDGVDHWPQAVKDKRRCRNCQASVRMMCSKCNIYLCIVPERNCFKNFHCK